ncbi:MAG: hypothetical protein WBG54_05895 [Acidobacteriaceae bacterium]
MIESLAGSSTAEAREGSPADRLVDVYRRLLAVALIVGAALAVAGTLHWPLAGDATLMHYGAFLLGHGFAPYRQIIDMNMPGCFLLDWMVIHVFGPGALAWRIFDFSLIAAAAVAMISIAKPYDWLGGVFAAGFFFILHVHDGVDQAGERDLVLAILMLLGCAAIFRALRGSSWAWSAIFGLASGAAITIKPTAALWFPGMLVLAGFALQRRRRPMGAHLAAAFAGCAAPIALTFLYLAREGAVGAFVQTVSGLMIYHAHIDRFPLHFLLTHLVPSALYPAIALWLALAIAGRRWRTWEGAALLWSIGVGIASFVAQGKAFPYHRYPLEAFLLLAMGIDATLALRALRSAWQPFTAAALLVFMALALGPTWLIRADHYDWRHDDFTQSLTADLTALGGPALSGHVQCLDMTAGCLGVLYQMRLGQSTGFLYDCYFFHQPQTAVTQQLREEFLADMGHAPPRVLIETSQNCLGEPLSWRGPDAWPAFSAWRAANYSLYAERQPTRLIRWWPIAEQPPGYRIYVRRMSAPATIAMLQETATGLASRISAKTNPSRSTTSPVSMGIGSRKMGPA